MRCLSGEEERGVTPTGAAVRSRDMEKSWSELDLPGFRFHPTEEELLNFYLKGTVHGKKLEIIRTLNIYHYNPWELPGLARVGEREWYFFVPRDRRTSNGGRPNRTTERGFWKATGSDRKIRSVSEPANRVIGLKKTLVFYEGRAPRGSRTDWVMNEYRLPFETTATTTSSSSALKDDIVLCKIYRKATSMKELEQRAAMEEDARGAAQCGAASPADTCSSSYDQETSLYKPPCTLPAPVETDVGRMEVKVKTEAEKEAEVSSVPLASNNGLKKVLPELEMLQVPPRFGFDWGQDPFLRSPWLDHWSPYYANILNF